MRVLLLDDHLLFRAALASLLTSSRERIEILSADDLDTARLIAAEASLDLAIVNLALTESNGLYVLARLHAALPTLPIIALTSSREPARWRRALEDGAMGLVTRTTTPAELCTCMARAVAGVRQVPESLMREAGLGMPVRRGTSCTPLPDLSSRQQEVLEHLLRGESNKTISRALDISPNTVKTHLAAIFRALGARNRTEAVYQAAQFGIASN